MTAVVAVIAVVWVLCAVALRDDARKRYDRHIAGNVFVCSMFLLPLAAPVYLLYRHTHPAKAL